MPSGEKDESVVGVKVQCSDLPEGIRPICPASNMRYGGKIISKHYCEVAVLCKNGKSIFARCKFHSSQSFYSDPRYVAEFITFMEDWTHAQKA